MRFHFLLFLSLHYLNGSDAFVSSPTAATRTHSESVEQGAGIYSTTATRIAEGAWNDVHEFNIELDRLAEQSGSFDQPVISRAAACEDLWKKQADETDSTIVPDTISFNTVLKAWNRCCNSLSQSSRNHKRLPSDFTHSVDVYTPRDAAKRATSLLLHQEADADDESGCKPDTQSFNIVIDAWAKSRVSEAPEAAERLLRRMLDSESIQPDTLSYHGVLDAWANSGSEDSLDKVNQIYHHMETLHESGKDIAPSIRTVNAILNTYSKVVSGVVAQKDFSRAKELAADARSLLEQIKQKCEDGQNPEWQPDTTTYTSVMDVYSKCGSYDTTQEAESLLHELKQKFKSTRDPRVRPNFRTYTALIAAWSRTRSDEAPGRVEDLLQEMSSYASTKPNTRTYTSAIQTWAKSRDPSKARRALKILREMKDEYEETGNTDVRPGILTYNAAIHACSRVQGSLEQQTEAIKIAFAVLKAAEGADDRSCQPNQMTYSTLLRAVGFLLPPGNERNKVACAVFQKAKKAGMVDFSTLMNLRKSVDAEVMPTVLDGVGDKFGNFDYNDVPADWCKNVR